MLVHGQVCSLHKVINGANEEGNEINTVINNQATRSKVFVLRIFINIIVSSSRNKTTRDVRLVIHTPRLYVALHKFERYTAQKQFYK